MGFKNFASPSPQLYSPKQIERRNEEFSTKLPQYMDNISNRIVALNQLGNEI